MTTRKCRRYYFPQRIFNNISNNGKSRSVLFLLLLFSDVLFFQGKCRKIFVFFPYFRVQNYFDFWSCKCSSYNPCKRCLKSNAVMWFRKCAWKWVHNWLNISAHSIKNWWTPTFEHIQALYWISGQNVIDIWLSWLWKFVLWDINYKLLWNERKIFCQPCKTPLWFIRLFKLHQRVVHKIIFPSFMIESAV